MTPGVLFSLQKKKRIFTILLILKRPFSSLNKNVFTLKSTILKYIIAIGGGGFGRNPKHNLVEKYILKQSNVKKPNILFIPTASAEDKSYIVNFYSCF